MTKNLALTAAKLFILTAFVSLTNDGVLERINLLLAQERLTTIVFYTGVWAICIFCMLIAAFQPKTGWRTLWALTIAATTFAGHTFILASQSQLTIFDVASLWAAKADTGRAMSFYLTPMLTAMGVALFGFLGLILPPPGMSASNARCLTWLSTAPALPVALIVAIIFMKSGGGTHALPQQYAPAAMGLIVAAKSVTQDMPARNTVENGPQSKPAARHVILLVDESIRPDYIDFKPGNRLTPFLALNRDLFVNYGKAGSGNNCSHYANAILRLGGARKNLIKTVRTSPTIWGYAKRAGFRTVFIDAAASHIKNKGALQNFMTTAERAQIDEYHVIDNAPAPQLDQKLARLIAKLQARLEPHFIYANKNGAHIPYDDSYPAQQRPFRPVIADEAGGTKNQRKVNSYKNAVKWSVDGFFKTLVGGLDTGNIALLYTSDHGQNLSAGKVTHCNARNPDPREGLVPMLFMSGNRALAARFAASAGANFNRTTHFALFPTLVELFGYDGTTLGPDYGAPLTGRTTQPVAFTSGDIFGLFSNSVMWTAIDTSREHREDKAHLATASVLAGPVLRPGQDIPGPAER